MDTSIVLCGRTFTPGLIEHLRSVETQTPGISSNALARILCDHLAWYSLSGRPALSSAKVALGKLSKRGLLRQRGGGRARGARQLRRSSRPLPAIGKLPRRVDQLQGLCLHLVNGSADPLSSLWNDLIIDQHPCAAAPLVGAQLRYLIGSDHGWLGALGFGPAAFVLGARDQWIGWSTAARVRNLQQVVGLSRFLIRKEVSCTNLASKVLSMSLSRLAQDWHERYGVRPLLVETFVDRERFTGLCFRAANWRRVGASTGRGRLGPVEPVVSLKDIWMYELDPRARSLLQQQPAPVLTPCALLDSMSQQQWWSAELATADLGEARINERAKKILRARWEQPQASFFGTFTHWRDAKAAYGFIEHDKAPISLETILAPHSEATQERMAGETLVLLPQDTTTLNYTGLKKTEGLGPLGESKGRGLWLHSMLAYRNDGVPLGLLDARCWARADKTHPVTPSDQRGRNAKSIAEKESMRWVDAHKAAAAAARRMPQTQLVVIADREGDLYELYDASLIGPSNLKTLVRAQHDRSLESHDKLWAYMEACPRHDTRVVELPRHHGNSARKAILEIRWAAVRIDAPAVGHKKGWPALNLYAVWVHEPNPPQDTEPIDWMLLTDVVVETSEQAWQAVHWYRLRWGIEEWHRVLKTGCNAEGREQKTADNLKRVLAFDLIVAWRILACLKLGRTLPKLSARVIYTEEELETLLSVVKKKTTLSPAI